MKTPKTSLDRRWIERLLLVVGFVCLGIYGFAFVEARLYDFQQSRLLEQALENRARQRARAMAASTQVPAPRPGERPEQEKGEEESRIDEQEAPPASETDSFDTFEREMKEREEKGLDPFSMEDLGEGDLIGRIRIRDSGVSAIVLEGISRRTLRRGAGHIPGTSLPSELGGNVGIAAHRDSFFRGLKDIDRNDVIELTTPDGTWSYRVEWTRVVRPTQTEVLAVTDEPALTLVTCYPFYYVGSAPKRFIVRAHLIDGPEDEETERAGSGSMGGGGRE